MEITSHLAKHDEFDAKKALTKGLKIIDLPLGWKVIKKAPRIGALALFQFGIFYQDSRPCFFIQRTPDIFPV